MFFFFNCHKSPRKFLIYLLKKSASKCTRASVTPACSSVSCAVVTVGRGLTGSFLRLVGSPMHLSTGALRPPATPEKCPRPPSPACPLRPLAEVRDGPSLFPGTAAREPGPGGPQSCGKKRGLAEVMFKVSIRFNFFSSF